MKIFKKLPWLFLSILIAILLAEHVYANDSVAQNSPVKYARSKEFVVPEKLRPRVNFWKDIFTKYGKANIVIHHRNFPQIVFMVVDLNVEFSQMNPVVFDTFRKSAEKRYVAEIKMAFEELANNEQPQTQMQRMIATKMALLGPGKQKYRKALDEDLIRTQTGIKEKFAKSIQRSGRYLPIIEKIFVEDYGLPVEVTRLPFIESSFDYTAYSSVGAAGIWQFMPRTAKGYMTVNRIIDERRDPIEASRAAAQYLRSAYNRLGSWPLAVTSYNHGVGGVSSKVARMGTNDLATIIEHKEERAFGFASSNFYPEFLAACEIYENYNRYFPGLQLEPPIKAREVLIERPVTASQAAQQFGVNIDTLRAVNFAVAPAVWDGKVKLPTGYSLKVPDKSDMHLVYARLQEREIAIQNTTANSTSTIYGGLTYKVRRGDTIVSIAKKYGTSVADLRKINSLGTQGIKVGQVLTVKEKENIAPTKSAAVAESALKSKNTQQTSVQTRTTSYKVKKGDTLWTISNKYGISVNDLKSANKKSLGAGKLTVGKVLNIPLKKR